ncbi:hypothetical protein BAE44_0015967 [Dichanthelium oligosanthes]|uniref:PB1 domain-containing protein n=1 Tax=Dichanthelium oligosanthes TaxID=888268 RepID=A0A1E5VCY2_9POAL|nr:hypothetical protein BAE44_0015967 [Dichanthelium oligosanthes]
MAATSWSSSSSCTSSFGSLDDDVVCILKPDGVGAAAAAEGSVKFLCSYGGRILPRHTDGALRYVGGDNRVLSVIRPLQFYELQRKLRELCGWEVCLRCQLPTEDLDALVSVTSDDDLANLLEEYDAASKDRLQPLKIRAFLFPRTAPAPSLQPRCSPLSTPASVPRPSSNALLRRQNTSPAATARVPSPTCAPRWWAPPQVPSPARVHPPQRYDQHLVHNCSHLQ